MKLSKLFFSAKCTYWWDTKLRRLVYQQPFSSTATKCESKCTKYVNASISKLSIYLVDRIEH